MSNPRTDTATLIESLMQFVNSVILHGGDRHMLRKAAQRLKEQDAELKELRGKLLKDGSDIQIPNVDIYSSQEAYEQAMKEGNSNGK